MPADPAVLAALAEVERTRVDHERAVAQLRDVISGAPPPRGDVLTLQQAAFVLGVHEDTMADLAKRRGIGLKVGRRWRFTWAEVDALVPRVRAG